MKAKFVYERFEKGKKPVGLDSPEGIDHLIETWQKRGIKFGHLFFLGPDVEKKREFFSKYHTYIEKYMKQINEAGVPYEHMTLWGDHVDIRSYQIAKGNWSLFHCLTEDDAKKVIKVLEGITTGNQNFNISEERENINLSDKIHRESDPEHRKWEDEYYKKKGGEKRKTDLDFLDKIEETRKKLDSIK
jgi:hypothetical protein